jgi:hypothetical protein
MDKITINNALNRLLEQAAKRGAQQALAELGLHDRNAGEDMRDLRGLLDAWRTAKRTIGQTLLRTLTVMLLIGMLTGVLIKLKMVASN